MHSTNLLLSPRNVWNWDAYIKFWLKWRHDFSFWQKKILFLLYEMGTFIFIHRFTPQDKLRLVEMIFPLGSSMHLAIPTNWADPLDERPKKLGFAWIQANDEGQPDWPPWPAFSIGADPLRLSIIFNNIRAVSARGFSVIDAGDRCA